MSCDLNTETLISRLHFKNQEIKTYHVKKKKRPWGRKEHILFSERPQKVNMTVGGVLIKGRVVCIWVEEETVTGSYRSAKVKYMKLQN